MLNAILPVSFGSMYSTQALQNKTSLNKVRFGAVPLDYAMEKCGTPQVFIRRSADNPSQKVRLVDLTLADFGLKDLGWSKAQQESYIQDLAKNVPGLIPGKKITVYFVVFIDCSPNSPTKGEASHGYIYVQDGMVLDLDRVTKTQLRISKKTQKYE